MSAKRTVPAKRRPATSRRKKPVTRPSRPRWLRFVLALLTFVVLLLLLDQLLRYSRPPAGSLLHSLQRFHARLCAPQPVAVPSATPPAAPLPVVRPSQPEVSRRPVAAPPASVDALIELHQQSAPASGPRYLYLNEAGELMFADRLEQIPAPLRATAQPLAGSGSR